MLVIDACLTFLPYSWGLILGDPISLGEVWARIRWKRLDPNGFDIFPQQCLEICAQMEAFVWIS